MTSEVSNSKNQQNEGQTFIVIHFISVWSLDLFDKCLLFKWTVNLLSDVDSLHILIVLESPVKCLCKDFNFEIIQKITRNIPINSNICFISKSSFTESRNNTYSQIMIFHLAKCLKIYYNYCTIIEPLIVLKLITI
jgi:hypothetical protein